jgi:hypothetical protein
MNAPSKLVAILAVLTATACGDLGTSPGSGSVFQQVPPAAMITGTVYLNDVPVAEWSVELTGWLDSQLTASTPLGARTTDVNGRYSFFVQPEAHHCGRMSVLAAPVLALGTSPRPVSPESGIHFPVQCGTTDSLDFHFETAP